MAAPEPWSHPDGTIHYYDARLTRSGMDWSAALDSSDARNGYLATLTGASENAFVFGLVDSSRFWSEQPGIRGPAGPWLGGHRSGGSPYPDSGWQWVSGEPFTFRNWSPGQPDIRRGTENALCFGSSEPGRVATWGAISDTSRTIRGYLTELSATRTTVGLLRNDSGASAGYSLFSPLGSPLVWLIDNKGRPVHSWWSRYRTASAVYLLENGYLARIENTGNPYFRAFGGRVEVLDWSSSPVWSYDYSNSAHCQHHDALWLPNGHVILLAYELKNRDSAIAAGRDSSLLAENVLWPEHLVEVDPATDSIVWEWHVWDHLIQDFDPARANYGNVEQHPELIDLNYGGPGDLLGSADWLHANALDYNERFDQIIISSRHFSEFWIIDHGTSTAEAGGHEGGRQGMGGDILYRWGNPQAYRAGDSTSQMLFGQHNPNWIRPGLPGAGRILIFNNGFNRPGDSFSTADEIIPPCDSSGHYARPAPGIPFGPARPDWSYGASPRDSFFSSIIGGAQRLPNGNTLVCEGIDGRFFEVTRDSQVVWEYVDPVVESVPLQQGDTFNRALAFRVTRFAPDYPGLNGRTLVPGYPIEQYSSPVQAIAEPLPGIAWPDPVLQAEPNPFRTATRIRSLIQGPGRVEMQIFAANGRRVRRIAGTSGPTGHVQFIWDGNDESGRSVENGIYYCRVTAGGQSAAKKLIRTE